MIASKKLLTGLVLIRLLPVYVLLGLLKHLLPLRWLTWWAWRAPARQRDRNAEKQLVTRVLRLSELVSLPDRDCLQRSLLLYRELSRAGADPILVVGFQRLSDRIVGHAWVIVDGESVIELASNLARISPVCSFGAQGALVRCDSSQFPVGGII